MKSSVYSSPLLPVLLTFLALSKTSLASTACNAATADPFPTSAADCNGNTECLALEQAGANNAVCSIDDSCTTSCDSDTDPSCLVKKREWRASKRATSGYTCNSSQTCYNYTNIAICVDWSTGDYTDEYGGHGNVITGEYTAADGSTQTVTAGGSATPGTFPTSTKGSSSSGATSITTTSSTTSGTTSTSASGASGVSATQSGAASNFDMPIKQIGGGILGAIGLAQFLL